MKLKFTRAELVEELRYEAEIESTPAGPGVPTLEETLAWQAADEIEKLEGALRTIRNGVPDPQTLARRALSED